MEINLNAKYNKYEDILSFVTQDSREQLLQAAEGLQPMYEMTLAQFFACCMGDFSCVIKDIDNPTTGEVLWVERFAGFVQTFAKVIEQLTPKQTAEQKQASNGLPSVEWREGMLVFVRSYFGLKSFAEAENVILADFLLAKKDDYRNKMYERNLHALQRAKLKVK